MLKVAIFQAKSIKFLQENVNNWMEVNDYGIHSQSFAIDPLSKTDEPYAMSILYEDARN